MPPTESAKAADSNSGEPEKCRIGCTQPPTLALPTSTDFSLATTQMNRGHEEHQFVFLRHLFGYAAQLSVL